MIAAKKLFVPLAAGSLILFSSGCSNMPEMNKATQGAVGGAVAGAVVGAQVGGVRGAVVGAVIGGVVGHQIGNYLDEQDKKKLAELELQALRSGKAQSFVANKSKEQVTITPGEAVSETVATYTLSPNVSNHKLELAPAKDISAYVDTPIYPDTNQKQRPRLVMKKGEKLVVPAAVAGNAQWGAVVEGDTVIGYVPRTYLEKKTARAYVAPAATKTKVAQAAPPPATAVAPASSGEVIKTADAASQVQPQKAAVIGNCKIVTRRVKDTTENMKWCQEPPSGWKNVEV